MFICLLLFCLVCFLYLLYFFSVWACVTTCYGAFNKNGIIQFWSHKLLHHKICFSFRSIWCVWSVVYEFELFVLSLLFWCDDDILNRRPDWPIFTIHNSTPVEFGSYSEWIAGYCHIGFLSPYTVYNFSLYGVSRVV